ncbi:MAG: elongation factor P [Bacteroidia bacterium]|nr:elongation factor P [Bacteroidia bacterium]QQR94912.1 MAG: elongation factor P [Bacteroidota bacterium]MBP7714494.1 elongation factor P [Bacteroidia bacterium]MBP8669400.1 elongation factor P [Bacteroidia bacterium]HMR46606.1 elongation factor P [Bacteroidia bacterium]
MADTGDIGIGSVIRFNGDLYQVVEYQHRTPGNLRAFYQAKLRNLKNGKLAENRFRSGEQVEVARVEYKTMQYLYKDGENLVVMDNETFEQHYIPEVMIGDSASYLKEEMMLKIAFEGDNPILAEPPTFVELVITYSEPGVKGDTATNTLKAATLETGAVVQVPLFVNEGEKIKIDTRTGTYVERVK